MTSVRGTGASDGACVPTPVADVAQTSVAGARLARCRHSAAPPTCNELDRLYRSLADVTAESHPALPSCWLPQGRAESLRGKRRSRACGHGPRVPRHGPRERRSPQSVGRTLVSRRYPSGPSLVRNARPRRLAWDRGETFQRPSSRSRLRQQFEKR